MNLIVPLEQTAPCARRWPLEKQSLEVSGFHQTTHSEQSDYFPDGNLWESEKINIGIQQHKITLILSSGMVFLMEIRQSSVCWRKMATFPLASEKPPQSHWTMPSHGHRMSHENFRCPMELWSSSTFCSEIPENQGREKIWMGNWIPALLAILSWSNFNLIFGWWHFFFL